MPYVFEDQPQGRYVFEDTPTATDRAGRVAGLGLRSVINAVTGVPTMMADAAAGAVNAGIEGVNKLGGNIDYRMQQPSAVLQNTMTKAGIPEPQNGVERFAVGATSAMGGIGGQLAAANALRAVPGAIPTTGQGVAEIMAQKPVQQLASGVTGTAGAQMAQNAGAGPVGQFAAGLAGSMVPFVPQMASGRTALNQAQQTARDSMDKGYRIPPSQANPGMVNNTLEGISGKIQTAQKASTQNQAVTNDLVRQDFGLPPDAPLTDKVFKEIRNKAGTAYARVADFGTYKTDPQFLDEITQLAGSQEALAKEVPEIANQAVLNITKSLSKPEFSGRTVVELTKALREKATGAFKAGETDAGRFYRGAAESVEDMIDRNLQAAGRNDLLPDFRAARQTIAKAHTAEAALNDTTGNVSARKLSAQMNKGKPLSGGMQSAARFADAFPKAAQSVETIGSQPGISPLDFYGALGAGAAGGIGMGPGGALLGLVPPVARPAIRAGILSGPYQRAMVAPQAGIGRPNAAALGILDSYYSRQ